jgi:hypothetical protein
MRRLSDVQFDILTANKLLMTSDQMTGEEVLAIKLELRKLQAEREAILIREREGKLKTKD